MAVFENIDHGFAITGLTTDSLLIEVTLASYSGPSASNRYIYDGRYPSGDSSSFIYIAGGSTSLNTSSASSVKLDGTPITNLTTSDITGGEVLSWVVSNHNGDLVIFNRFSLNEPVNVECNQVTIKTSDGLTTLHTYDLSNPTQSTITDSTGTVDGELLNFTFSSNAVIGNVDTDNAVNQHQQDALITLSNFTESITSVTLNGEACPIQSQVVGSSVTVNIPGNLATGSYNLVVSGSTESATLTGVSYTQTHERPAFYGLVDNNSILYLQSFTPNTYFRFVTNFSNGTLNTSAGDADSWANDISDYYTPDTDYEGDDSASLEFLYEDGSTSATVSITISVGNTVVVRIPNKLFREFFSNLTFKTLFKDT